MLKIMLAALAIAVASPALAQDVRSVSEDPALLPPPVAAKREALIAAARSGDIEALGEIMAAEPMPVTVSFGDPNDPVAYLREASADGKGIEILAILADLLAAPYAELESADGTTSYVWPYLAVMDDFRAPTPQMLVDAYRLTGVETFREQQELGGWLWWRVYIGEDGALTAFVAGD